mmetsp:Transcript_215/g.376  ORF Transcript_215/g.376 Transcript_215/m.376 type:complete len:88 (-) Transcript_215:132-395(-)
MARSSFLPLLLVAALFVVPAFVPSPAPRSVPNTAATSAAAGLLPLLVVQPAMAEDYMMPPSWPFLLVFAVLASALLVVGNFIFPGKK